jgi:hypothetical protein
MKRAGANHLQFGILPNHVPEQSASALTPGAVTCCTIEGQTEGHAMSKKRDDDYDDSLPETITLAEAARKLGVAVETCAKLGPAEGFPPPFWIGGKRMVGRRRFEDWLQAKIDGRPAA